MTDENEMMRGVTETGLDFRVYLSGRQWVAEISKDGLILKEQPFDCTSTPCLGIDSRDRQHANVLVSDLCRLIDNPDAVQALAEVAPYAEAEAECRKRIDYLIGVKMVRSYTLSIARADRELARGDQGEVVGFLSAPVWHFDLNATFADGSGAFIRDRIDGLLCAATYIEERAANGL